MLTSVKKYINDKLKHVKYLEQCVSLDKKPIHFTYVINGHYLVKDRSSMLKEAVREGRAAIRDLERSTNPRINLLETPIISVPPSKNNHKQPHARMVICHF